VADFSIRNLREAEDVAAKHGLSEFQEARFPREELGAESTGLVHLVVHPGKRQPFAHRHGEAEEIYVVISGGGRMKLDDEVVEVGALDAIRVGPSVTRMFEAGPEGLELLGFGPHRAGDAETVRDFWAD
jgi:mannose-6-phosphate isomerase-like protein (cupin superfamily)